ncbi:glycosyltransferase [Gammaproteobacteria bacterium]|nr:glycosyltransferase [Gammaproteobacteria bacterium]
MTTEIESISYCISTNGQQMQKTLKQIRSISETMKDVDTEFEVIVAGVIDDFAALHGELNLVAAHQVALDGRLGKLRNIAAANTRSEIIVFVDDDIIFPVDWMSGLIRFSKGNSWDILGNRILLPDGTRYWDRATASPHRMVHYDHPADDPLLYQCGCFWVMRRAVFDREKWDESIKFYSEKEEGTNEDVEYSKRLTDRGYVLKFDKDNYVWHWDDRYSAWYTDIEGLRCIRKEEITRDFGVDHFPDVRPEFTALLEHFDTCGR